MTASAERYAVYWVPQYGHPMGEFGAKWTGWCTENGVPHRRFDAAAIGLPLAALTRETARHGIHGVICAPFRLAQDRSPWMLQQALEGLAECVARVQMPRFKIALVDDRLALVPEVTCMGLVQLCSKVQDCIGDFVCKDPGGFVAPRRNELPLPSRTDCRDLPVLDGDRFFLPLTDPVSPGHCHELVEKLRGLLAPLMTQSFRIGDIALMCDCGHGRPLQLLHRYGLHRQPPTAANLALPAQGPTLYAPLV